MAENAPDMMAEESIGQDTVLIDAESDAKEDVIVIYNTYLL
jgi:hypothetical protein